MTIASTFEVGLSKHTNRPLMQCCTCKVGALGEAIASMHRIADVCKAAANLAKKLMEAMEDEDV